ncbi:Bug family tripartite tricarboxylate transporter substrate binding protein [Cupriavidus pauculus]|uniref:Bug family tripartite tricarboxylate transporter substrate binding protein n=1 Tax=Cupriavidus pauculus TaxID=82633 RepID=UPI001CBE248F|nr:tripartite tricarboxylate transporter substrate binding protein [Cupriavidus pauculus]
MTIVHFNDQYKVSSKMLSLACSSFAAGVTRTTRAVALSTAALFGAVASPGQALAQPAWPDKPISFVVPYSAGGAVDVVGRALGQKLSEGLGKPVVVDNKPGFSGNIGAQQVAKAPADGYTLLMAALTSYSINATLLQASNGYSLLSDFTPVAVVGNLPIVLLVNSSLPVGSVHELIKLAASKPGQIAFGSSGNGSIEHVAAEMFKRQAKVDLLHVPYKGAAPAIADLLGGQIQVMFATAPTAISALRSGKLKALAVATPRRVGVLPDVPTATEAGLKDFEVPSTYGVLVRTGTPKSIITRMNAELQKSLQMPDVKTRFQAQGIDIVMTTPEEAELRVRGEVAKWAKVIQETHITAQ